MAEPLSERRGFPILWVTALALMVAACVVGLVLQLGASRAERDDQAGATEVEAHRAPAASPGSKDGLPAFGESVYVEELPEPLTKVPPQYPQNPQWAGVSGTVIVQALIGQDGRVKETKVVNSIPGLDEAAVAAIEQWTFKPARVRGEAIAVWVAVPVKFTLK